MGAQLSPLLPCSCSCNLLEMDETLKKIRALQRVNEEIISSIGSGTHVDWLHYQMNITNEGKIDIQEKKIRSKGSPDFILSALLCRVRRGRPRRI